CMQALNFPWTF
nr:immunoglobulin light chain junction region [Macaca mulatta]MOW51982.1 immunoglobulin light chain junction region [Macaca mulatta]MOW52152.1 immunoglobulin light chain junction region [Macaca mulatta]MOW52358.1 immunoglobulin light chain junction region [Macaca mulatta]MOW52363.1 immunoglobulin light chain junction region [Macaca mulatta]